MSTPAPPPPNVFGMLAVCSLVFGAALLFVAHNAGDAGSPTLFYVVGFIGLGIALALAVPAARSRRGPR